MLKEKHECALPSEASEINLDVCGAEIEISGNAPSFSVEYAENAYCTEVKDSKVFIKRTKKHAMGKPYLKITIPDSFVPDLHIQADKSSLSIEGGLYGEITSVMENSKVNLDDLSAEVLIMKGNETSSEYTSVTAKTALIVNIKTGDLFIHSGFFSRADINMKTGNFGLWESDFHLFEIKSNKGNIHAMLAGDENDYTISSLAKGGITNIQNGGCGQKNFRAGSAHGNIFIDYSEESEKEEADYDNLTTDSEREIGQKVC